GGGDFFAFVCWTTPALSTFAAVVQPAAMTHIGTIQQKRLNCNVFPQLFCEIIAFCACGALISRDNTRKYR
ncbi:hypothetical protein, partial [Bifidobacterium bifidum]|uniref:hypothetical protein n=1 Tax=Bifidobacterium bifidum TaxID=1681 RepID=UPI0034A22E76